MRVSNCFGVATALLAGSASWATARSVDSFVATPLLDPASPAAVAQHCDRYLAEAQRLRAAVEAETGEAGIATTFRRYDDFRLVLDSISNDAGIIAATAPDEPRRDAGRQCAARVEDAANASFLSRPIYDRLKGIDLAGATPAERHIVTRAIGTYDRAGVGQGEAARARIAALQARITKEGIAFDANIANSRNTIAVAPADLAGLPADYVAAHPPGPDGKVTISTDYPDLVPAMTYATSDDLRHRLSLAMGTRAWPQNDAVLSSLIADRDQLARLLGRKNYAALVTEDKMIGSPDRAASFLAEVAAIAEAPGRRDKRQLLDRLRLEQPRATDVRGWQASRLEQLVQKETYAVDRQEVRKYFAYDNVRDGILTLTQDLFGVKIRPWKTAVWAPGVEPYEMLENGRVIGRFYLDSHPRPGKYSHAAQFDVRQGLAGRAVPVAALITNFPAGGHATGLMEHGDVETFLHEFGHLLHTLFSGQQDWQQGKMGSIEWDFVEAPSQMLENWVWDYETLRRFAVDKDGNVIPRALVDRMNRARAFGEAMGDRTQFGYANSSLSLYQGPPPADLTAAHQAAVSRFALFPPTEGTHQQASFGHLNGYSAIYYTYSWSKVIASDLFTRFETRGLRDRATAMRYRTMVLAPGSTRPAAELISGFLERPTSFAAYRARLQKDD